MGIYIIIAAPILATLSMGNNEIAHCASKVLRYNDNGRNFVLTSSPANSNLESLLTTLKDYTLIDLNNIQIIGKANPLFYLFLLNDHETFERYIETVLKTSNWNPRLKMLIINYGNQTLKAYFQIAFKYSVINVAVLQSNLKIYTYFPFSSEQCGEHVSISTVYDCKSSNASIENVYPIKLPNTFNGCKIRAIALILPPYVIDFTDDKEPGLEIKLLHEIAKILNLKIYYTNHTEVSWGGKVNQTFTGLFKYLQDNESDLLIGAMNDDYCYENIFDCTNYVMCEYITFFVPPPLPIESWKNLIILFDIHIWYCLILTLIITILVWWLIGLTRQNDSERYDILINCVLEVWGLIFSSFNKKPTFWLFRYLFVLWIIFVFIMTSAYQGIFIGFLTKQSYDKPIETVADIANSALIPTGHSIPKRLFNESNNAIYYKIYKNYISFDLHLTRLYIKRLITHKDIALLRNGRTMDYYINKYFVHEGKQNIKRIKETVWRFTVKYATRKGFVYLDRFNKIIYAMQENGFLNKWENDMYSTPNLKESNNKVRLTFNHLKVAFIQLLIGNLLALVCFLNEILSNKLRTFKLWIISNITSTKYNTIL